MIKCSYETKCEELSKLEQKVRELEAEKKNLKKKKRS